MDEEFSTEGTSEFIPDPIRGLMWCFVHNAPGVLGHEAIENSTWCWTWETFKAYIRTAIRAMEAYMDVVEREIMAWESLEFEVDCDEVFFFENDAYYAKWPRRG